MLLVLVMLLYPFWLPLDLHVLILELQNLIFESLFLLIQPFSFLYQILTRMLRFFKLIICYLYQSSPHPYLYLHPLYLRLQFLLVLLLPPVDLVDQLRSFLLVELCFSSQLLSLIIESCQLFVLGIQCFLELVNLGGNLLVLDAVRLLSSDFRL